MKNPKIPVQNGVHFPVHEVCSIEWRMGYETPSNDVIHIHGFDGAMPAEFNGE